MSNIRVTFHTNSGAEVEEFFGAVAAARNRINDIMTGKSILETEEDGKRVFVATHHINGAIIHPQPVADD